MKEAPKYYKYRKPGINRDMGGTWDREEALKWYNKDKKRWLDVYIGEKMFFTSIRHGK